MSDFNIENLNDFGFCMVDETELESYQELVQTKEVSDTAEEKLDKLYNAITPLLTNLKMSPSKEYVFWPDRVEKIEEFEARLAAIVEE